MPSLKKWLVAGLALALLGRLGAGRAAEPAPTCGGAMFLRELLPADPAFARDENAAIWQRASRCDWSSMEDSVGDRAISQFEDAARDNGLAGGLRTFARNGDFRLYVVGQVPMALGAANSYLDHQPVIGTWQDQMRGRSADSTLLYAVGEVLMPRGRRYQYAQVWEFDPKVANWGVRLLLLKSITKK